MRAYYIWQKLYPWQLKDLYVLVTLNQFKDVIEAATNICCAYFLLESGKTTAWKKPAGCTEWDEEWIWWHGRVGAVRSGGE